MVDRGPHLTFLRPGGRKGFVVSEPTPALPRCCVTHRLAGVDVLETMLVNDVRSTHDEMVGNGWPPEAALDSVRNDYRSWVLGRFGDAIELGCALIELEVTA